jgi:fumarylpyruvate hydrolase
MQYLFDPAPHSTIAIANNDARFPVRRIFCVGRNYVDHIREMGGDPKREPPVFFTKPADAIVAPGAQIPFPQATANLHYEVELVLALGAGGADIPMSAAPACIWGYGVGCDLTRRDRQAEAKQAGAPWDAAKAFDMSAPIGVLTPASSSDRLGEGRIWLSVNGETKQDANLSQMIWSPSEIVAALSQLWTLRAGDLVFTGTPAGVGPLQPGDAVLCGVDGLSNLDFAIAAH